MVLRDALPLALTGRSHRLLVPKVKVAVAEEIIQKRGENEEGEDNWQGHKFSAAEGATLLFAAVEVDERGEGKRDVPKGSEVDKEG